DQSDAAVAASCAHVEPPSVLLKIPAPRNRLPPAPPPVPAYIKFVSVGLMASALTTRLARKSSTGAHDSPPLVVLQIPPPGLLIQIRFGSAGWTRMVVMRPPMFPGPSQVQELRPIPAASPTALSARIRLTWSSARMSAPGGMRPSSSARI